MNQRWIYQKMIILNILKLNKQDSTLCQLQLDDQNTQKQLPYEFQILNQNQSELSSYLERSVTKIHEFGQYKENLFFQFLVIYLGCTKAEQLSIIILQRIIKYKKYLNMRIKYLLFFNKKPKMDLTIYNQFKYIEFMKNYQIQLESVKEMIKQLEQREADIYRIKTLKQQLIRRIVMGDDKWKIINQFEQQFYIMNIIFRNQIIFGNFIFIILNIAFLQKNLKNLWNWHQQLQNQWILIIIRIVTKKEFQKFSNQLLKSTQMNLDYIIIIITFNFQIIFEKQFGQKTIQLCRIRIRYNLNNNQFYQQSVLQIQLLFSAKYLALIQHLLIKKDNKLIKSINLGFLCLDTQDFDPQLFKLFLKYVYIQKQLMKSDSEQQQYLSDLGKFNQNFIIYEDRLGLKKQEVLHIQNSQWQY
ncbi:unnamed protein product [Paramecium pentaurelia]|uniref:Transmembrane protein n=1 Tax=Paramecium pentaurelia TaxID=43138 RepID=A0A8S1Y1U1_9CILI|nr:unnamed protein product [Paramecium pentaurelia]